MREVPKDYNPIDRQDIVINTRPTAMPELAEGQSLVCEYVRAPGMPSLNPTYICDTVDDMQQLFDGCAGGGAIQLNWYITNELVKILVGEAAERWLKGEEQ
jgi:hypothetical protein